MKFDWQYIVVGIIFLGAIYFVVKTIRKSAKGDSCESGNCNCSPAESKTKTKLS